jgi:hypothetical protein
VHEPPHGLVISWDISPGGRSRRIPAAPARSRCGSSPRLRSGRG